MHVTAPENEDSPFNHWPSRCFHGYGYVFTCTHSRACTCPSDRQRGRPQGWPLYPHTGRPCAPPAHSRCYSCNEECIIALVITTKLLISYKYVPKLYRDLTYYIIVWNLRRMPRARSCVLSVQINRNIESIGSDIPRRRRSARNLQCLPRSESQVSSGRGGSVGRSHLSLFLSLAGTIEQQALMGVGAPVKTQCLLNMEHLAVVGGADWPWWDLFRNKHGVLYLE